MKLLDIVRMAIHNLRRRPLRTLLNLLGIKLGTTAILMTAAGSRGVKDSLHSLLEDSESVSYTHLTLPTICSV